MTEIGDRWYSRPGIWFWIVIALGAALRFYLVVFTDGTQDVAIWERHARDVRDHGLIGYYHGDPSANHPPFISEVESWLFTASDTTGVPFRIFLRAPFAMLDAVTTFLLLLLLGVSQWRFLTAAVYWLNPLSIIFSAYHGNTDSAVAFFLLLCVWLLSKDKLLAAAIALGVSLWIKLPTVLAIPALFFFISNWRRRFLFLAVAAVAALATYVPALIQDPAIVWQNVFGYRAQILHTIADVPAWGPRLLLFSIIAAPQNWPETFHAPILFFLAKSWLIAVGLALVVTWLRRSVGSVTELCATIAGIYIIVLALSECFALLDRLLHAAQNCFFQKFDVAWIDNCLIDLDQKNFAGAVGSHFYFSARCRYFDCLFFKLSLRLGHLRLHLLRLFHQFIEIHRRGFRI